MKLNDKSAAVLLATLSEFTINQLKDSDLNPLFQELKAYFIAKDKYHVIWTVRKTSVGLEVDFQKLNDILGENNE
jgi:hypothetical protein